MPRLFLMRLLHVRLPARITDPEDIRAVSVLAATGLIEAEIETLGSTARYAASRVATVFRITEEGYAELGSMLDTRTQHGATG